MTESSAEAARKKSQDDFRIAAMRTVFSALIAAFSLLMLMVAALQQQAKVNLDAIPQNSVGYASAHAKAWGQRDIDRRLALAQQYVLYTKDKMRETLNDVEETLHEKQAMLAASEEEVARFAAIVRDSGRCPSLPAASPDEKSLWGDVYQCWYQSSVPDELRDQIRKLAGSANDPTLISDQIAKARTKVQSVQVSLASSEADVQNLQGQLARNSDFTEPMTDVILFDDSPLGWLGLTWIPPATMQIVLSFVSGLFGSLLVTLVLAVYPNNDLHFTSSDSYWNRILLGGLIAVGVYIVLGGGMAVLSAGKADTVGSTNFLSFCAIGMLAGMFSDRFAGWLSRNADMLIAQKGGGTARDNTIPDDAKGDPTSSGKPAEETDDRQTDEALIAPPRHRRESGMAKARGFSAR